MDLCTQPKEVEEEGPIPIDQQNCPTFVDSNFQSTGCKNNNYKHKEKNCRAFRSHKKFDASKNLIDLMTIKESNINLLLATKSFGLNDFSSIQLEMTPFVEQTINPCIMNVTEKESNHISDQDLLFQLKKSIVSIEESPCNDIETFPMCENYCGYQKNLTTFLTKQDIQTIMRYILQYKT